MHWHLVGISRDILVFNWFFYLTIAVEQISPRSLISVVNNFVYFLFF